ncbi:MAG: PilZ domain-containing protein [Terracidiphilus sp.]|jgi:hypothetical protein
MNQGSKAQIHQFPGSTALKHRQNVVPKYAPEEGPAPGPDRQCVYNQSQERFISTGVLAVGSSNDSADARLRSIGPGGGAALWIFPFEEISPTSVRFPLDLVFLSGDCVVLNIVESFPISGAHSSGAQAASMLVFPADTLAQGEILPGDQLIICAPEEMKRQLKRLQDAKDSVPGGIDAVSRRLKTNQQPQATTGTELQSVSEPANNLDRVETSAVRESSTAAAAVNAPAKRDVAERPWAKRDTSRSFFQRLLLGDPPEPRSAPRVVVPGLIAYFFTGGPPTPYEVSDISTSGLYIVTNERWYIGTIILLTLTDRHNPKTERSLSVNGIVVRLGSDGVGFEFLLDGDNRLEAMHMGPDHRTGSVDIKRLKGFIDRLRDL